MRKLRTDLLAATPGLHRDAGPIVEHRPRLLNDRDRAALAARPELDLAVLCGEDRVVAADACARAGPEASAALADKDGTGEDDLAVVALDAQTLRLGVTAAFRAAAVGCRASVAFDNHLRWAECRRIGAL